ncbi:MAG: hypothetical protein IIV67_03285, partial [Bacteroidaceae bacterium]|nr:hypothetical protein [Bacteroidaceae bacterium]
AGCKFIYSGYRKFKPTLTFKQENGKLTGFYLGVRSYLCSITGREDLRESELSENEDFEERKKNEKIDMQRRHALWIETPCKLEVVKEFKERGITLPPNMGPGLKKNGGSIRPVADKKWKGKM